MPVRWEVSESLGFEGELSGGMTCCCSLERSEEGVAV